MFELLLFTTGLLVGTMNAVAGGGMLVGFPVMVALGVPPLVANATGCIISGPGVLASAFGYKKYLKMVPRHFAWLLIPMLFGSIGGALTLRNTSADHFSQIVPVLVLFGVGLFAFQPLLHFHIKQHLHGKHRTLTPLFWIAIALLPVAFYGGYFGAGIGFMMLAFLSFAHLKDVHMMNAMKNIGAAAVSLGSFIVLHNSGLIDWKLGLIMGSGTVIGGFSGAHFSQRLSSHWIRIIVIAIGLSAVVYLSLQRY